MFVARGEMRRQKDKKKKSAKYVVSGLEAPVDTEDADFRSIKKRLESSRQIACEHLLLDDGSSPPGHSLN